ncbi:CBO0543 family protein [Bacillus sp. Marseille-Q3570]|uniref:CBO0543 family protein n=1 Tax=Bacillus sp. Marseille-Q3570 TaxID=2963522 RepID=UPI0021B74B9F|nr:CBO0543 family protein [Bacillus sp. Marseille-Q3570]
MHLSISVLALYGAWKWGDWKNWNRYHATMLYLISMNLLYFFLCKDRMLWRIVPDAGIPYVISELLYLFIVFPATVLLFIGNYPTSTGRKLLHILKWVGIYIGLEALGKLFGKIEYFHGWNIFYSFLFLCVMFPMLRLHYLKPLIAYIVSLVIIAVLLMYFKVSLNSSSLGLIWT